MTRWRLFFACALGLLAFAALDSTARAAARPHVAFLGSVVKNVDSETRDAIDGGTVAGIQETAAIYVGLTDGFIEITNGQPCATAACLASLKDSSGADYFVITAATGTGAGFTIDAQVLRAQPYAVVFSEHFDCPGCIPLKVRDRIQTNVALLVAKLVESLNNNPEIHGAAPPATAARPAGPDLVSHSPPAPLNGRKILGISLLGGAAAGLAAGGVLLYLNDANEDCHNFSDGQVCDQRRSTVAASIVAFSVGAALGIAGGIVLYQASSGATARIDIRGNRLAFEGAF